MDVKNRRGGMYWVGDKPYISVTHALQIIDKPQLRYWYGQQVYLATVKDPSIDERTALSAPYAVSKKSADRGSTIHSLIEAYRQNGVIIDTVPDELKGYANAFYKWANDHKPIIQESEKTVVNEEYKYAGTLDMLADIAGKRYVIDFKTNKTGSVYDEAHMQVSAYIKCLSGIDGGIIVALAEDGTYTHQLAKDGFKAFLSALNLYAFINENKLATLGWKGGQNG